LGDRCVKWFKGKQKTIRNSREEPPLKKNKLEEKNAEERARLADGKEVHQVDYMSPKPWYHERIVKPLGPYLTW
ncbi:hypothetical protein C5167_034465, partial [Papaver somniferum]